MKRASDTRVGTRRSRGFKARLSLVSLVCMWPCLSLYASVPPATAEIAAAPAPVAQIDLLPLGYAGLSAGARQAGGSNLSVDFLDPHHVLMTFNPKKLFKR